MPMTRALLQKWAHKPDGGDRLTPGASAVIAVMVIVVVFGITACCYFKKHCWWYNYRKAAARKALLDAKVQQADVELASVTVFRPPPPPFQIKLLAPRPSAYESAGRGGGYMPTDDLGPAAADGAQGDYTGSEAYETESEQGARR